MSLDPSFAPTLAGFARQIGVEPGGAAAILLSESNLDPTAFNGIGAAGINQLIPGNYSVFSPLSVNQYLSLSATQQLPYVFRFWQGVIRSFGKGQTFFGGRDLYWLNYKPGTFVPGAPDDHVIGPTGGDPALDHGNKGFITAGDLGIRLDEVAASHPNTWAALVAGLGLGRPSVAGTVLLTLSGLVAGAAVYTIARRRAA